MNISNGEYLDNVSRRSDLKIRSSNDFSGERDRGGKFKGSICYNNSETPRNVNRSECFLRDNGENASNISKREYLENMSRRSDVEKSRASIDVSRRQYYDGGCGDSVFYSDNSKTDTGRVINPALSNRTGNFSGNVNTRFEPSLNFRPHSGISSFSGQDQRSFSENGKKCTKNTDKQKTCLKVHKSPREGKFSDHKRDRETSGFFSRGGP